MKGKKSRQTTSEEIMLIQNLCREKIICILNIKHRTSQITKCSKSQLNAKDMLGAENY